MSGTRPAHGNGRWSGICTAHGRTNLLDYEVSNQAITFLLGTGMTPARHPLPDLDACGVPQDGVRRSLPTGFPRGVPRSSRVTPSTCRRRCFPRHLPRKETSDDRAVNRSLACFSPRPKPSFIETWGDLPGDHGQCRFCMQHILSRALQDWEDRPALLALRPGPRETGNPS